MEKQHNSTTKNNAFVQANEAHKLLSARLGDNLFFYKGLNGKNHPRSADVVVYAYLLEEIEYLKDHIHVVDSLNNHPNLLRFVQRMNDMLSQRNRKINIPEYSLVCYYFLSPPKGGEDYYPPALPIKIYEETNWEHLKYRLRGQTPPLKIPDEDSPKRRAYVTSISAILFLFIYLKKHLS